MADNEDLKQANAGAPAADIPDLKKKEKERKKAGAGWGAGGRGGAPFSGAAGGTVARAAASAGGVGGVGAAGSARAFSALLAGLRATALGKALLAAGAAVFLLGAGLLGYALLQGGNAGGGLLGGDLGALSSGVKVRAGGGDRLGYGAGKGEITFDPVSAKPAKNEETPARENPAEQAPGGTEDTTGQPPDWKGGGLAYDLRGAKLTSSLGGSFGAKNIFSGSGGAAKFNDSSAKVNIPGARKGTIAAMRGGRTGRVTRSGARRGVKANKAFGQLRVAKGLSVQGAGTSVAEGARASAAQAFEGRTGSGDVANVEAPGMPNAPATPNKVGAPDVTAPNVDVPGGVPVDQSMAEQLAAIAALAKQAGQMKKMGMMLMALGLILIIAGIIAMQFPPVGTIIGAILIGLGGMFIGMGIAMSVMASMMKAMADAMSSALAQSTGDVNQDATNKYCIDKAYNEGSDPADCDPPDSVTKGKKFDTDDSGAVRQHETMVKETGRIEGVGGGPTSP